MLNIIKLPVLFDGLPTTNSLLVIRNTEHFRNQGCSQALSWLDSFCSKKPVLELNKKVKNYDLNYTSDSREFEENMIIKKMVGFPPVHSHTRTDLSLSLLTKQEQTSHTTHTTHMAVGVANSTQKLLQ